MILSFIIPCLNGASTLAATLESIFAQETELMFEVIVIDNGSSDASISIARSFPVKIFTEKRKGPNHARNLGMTMASGKYLAFIDADVTIDRKWAQNLITYMEKFSLAAASGKIIRTALRDPTTILEEYRSLSQDHPTQGMSLVTPERNIGFINTAACIYRADVLRSIEAFSSTMKFHEDVDLTYKLRNLPGISLGCTGTAIAHCYYANGVLAYFRRAFVYGYYYAFLEKKWELKKKSPAKSELASLRLRIFDRTLTVLRQIGQSIGKIRLLVFPFALYAQECAQWKRIASLSRISHARVYFEEIELTIPNQKGAA